MTDNYRDEFQVSESEVVRRSDEILFKSIRIVVSFSIFIILLMFAIRIDYQIKWIIIGILFCICDTIIWILTSIWLSQQQYPKIAKVFLGIAQNSTLGLLPIFVLLYCFQADQIINQNSILIVLPLFIWEIFLLSFLIFIIPGLCDANYGSKKWVLVIIFYYIAILYVEIATLIQLQYHFNWYYVISLLIFSILYNIIVLITDCNISIIWPCIILITFIYSLIQLTNILNLINQQEQPSKLIQYYTIIPLLILSLINLFKQIIV